MVEVEGGATAEPVKANGKAARKQFLLTDKTCAGGSVLQGTRRHSWAELTTRKHDPGLPTRRTWGP